MKKNIIIIALILLVGIGIFIPKEKEYKVEKVKYNGKDYENCMVINSTLTLNHAKNMEKAYNDMEKIYNKAMSETDQNKKNLLLFDAEEIYYEDGNFGGGIFYLSSGAANARSYYYLLVKCEIKFDFDSNPLAINSSYNLKLYHEKVEGIYYKITKELFNIENECKINSEEQLVKELYNLGEFYVDVRSMYIKLNEAINNGSNVENIKKSLKTNLDVLYKGMDNFNKKIASNDYCVQIAKNSKTIYPQLAYKTIIDYFNYLILDIQKLETDFPGLMEDIYCAQEKGNRIKVYQDYYDKLSQINLDASQNRGNTEKLRSLKAEMQKYRNDFNTKILSFMSRPCTIKEIDELAEKTYKLENNMDKLFFNDIPLNDDQKNHVLAEDTKSMIDELKKINKDYKESNCDDILSKNLNDINNPGEKEMLKQQKSYCNSLKFQKQELDNKINSNINGLKESGYDTKSLESSFQSAINDWNITLGGSEARCELMLGSLLGIINNIYKGIIVILALIVIIFGMLDFVKATTNHDDNATKKAIKHFTIRIAGLIILILLPMLLEMLFNFFDLKSTVCGISLK